MTPEQRDDGPQHFAGSLGRSVLEIYPSKGQGATTITFGFAVESINVFRAAWLSAGGLLEKHEQMVIDPDGNSVFIEKMK